MTDLEQYDGLGQIWVALQRVLQSILLDIRQQILQSSTSIWCSDYISILAAWTGLQVLLGTSA